MDLMQVNFALFVFLSPGPNQVGKVWNRGVKQNIRRLYSNEAGGGHERQFLFSFLRFFLFFCTFRK